MSSLNTSVSEKEAQEAHIANLEAHIADLEARIAKNNARIAELKKIHAALNETERKANLLLPQGCSQAARAGFF
jgi:prefoldin subunit 5